MAALQQINQGTAAANGSDGDTVRSAFTKVNANMTALGAQVVFSSGPTLSSSSVLDNTVLGKRVIINFSSNGSVTLPKASTCQFDGVIQLVNISAVTATLPVVSGDTGPSFSLSPGESTTVFTDGVSTWTASERNRSTKPNESVSGSLAVAGKVSSVNAPNLINNGSAEFGTRVGGLGGFLSTYTGTAGEGTYYYNPAAITSTVYAGTTSIPCTAGTAYCLQGEMMASGVTAGYAWMRLVFLDSSNNVLGTLAQVGAANGTGWNFYYATATAPANASVMYVQLGVENSPNVSVWGLAYRRIKVERGSAPSTYSQEASIAYLQSASVGAGALVYADVTASRAIGTTYTNSTPRPLFISVEAQMPATQNSAAVIRVNGGEIGVMYNHSGAGGLFGTLCAIVPPGATYQVANAFGTFTLSKWSEY